MPFYEYQCKNCGHDLEAMQKITEAPLKKCPHCGKSQLQRLMSAPVFRLKGGGWYETDFKGDKDNQRNLADRPEADAKAAGDGAKEAVKDSAQDGQPAGGNGKDAKGAESQSKDAPSKDAPSKDKPADKSAAAPEPTSSKKAEAASAPGKSTKRGRTTARGKPVARRPVKKQASRTKRRR
ncbi:MAG: FmdB family zinc ribbon protein [Steroidobacteraceae bacterium]